MFQFNEKLKRLDIPAKSVMRLQRSLGDVQVALPGIKAQRATAYVCAFSVEQGLRVAIAFHLRDTNSVVYYLNDGNKTRKEIADVLTEGVVFTETLGFILSDLDIHQADPEERDAIWESLPLKNPPKLIDPKKSKVENAVVEEKKTEINTVTQKTFKVEAAVDAAKTSPQPDTAVDIDLGFPRAPSLVSMRRKKAPPTADELEEMRNRLRERLGRFLSSM